MFCAIVALLFGLSLLPGRKPLCLRFAERISDGILPDGTVSYCKRLTWVWLFILLSCSAVSVLMARCFGGMGFWAASVMSGAVVALTFFVEGIVRRRRFSVVFHTSGSTSKPKEIVVTSLDLEDITVEDIETDVPLFGEGLGLDSIDALELGMAVKKEFGITFSSNPADNKKIFHSVKSLADYIESQGK